MHDVPTAPGGDVVVHVELLDEGVEVSRPVLAAREEHGYRLPAAAPETEQWALPPGSLVHCTMQPDGTLQASAVV